MNAKFNRAPKMRLYEYVSDEIENAIRDKQILPGEKLPSEHELADQFNVSRTIIREALKILRERRLITVLDGKGAFVLSPTPEESTEALSRYIDRLDLRESHEMLFEVRLMIEPELAFLAAQRSEKTEIDALEKCMLELKKARNDPEKWIERDLKFHKIIAKSTHNPYGLVFIETLLNHMDFLVGSGFLLEGAIEATIFQHEEIVEAMRQKDAAKARDKMREHIVKSRERLSQAINKLSTQEQQESG